MIAYKYSSYKWRNMIRQGDLRLPLESNLGKMKHTFKPYLIRRSLMALFGTKKGVNPHTRYPDAYYGRVAFDKPMFQGIELVAKIEKTVGVVVTSSES